MRPPEKQNPAAMHKGFRPWRALECLLVFLIAPWPFTLGGMPSLYGWCRWSWSWP